MIVIVMYAASFPKRSIEWLAKRKLETKATMYAFADMSLLSMPQNILEISELSESTAPNVRAAAAGPIRFWAAHQLPWLHHHHSSRVL
jgi:hypothetical protein